MTRDEIVRESGGGMFAVIPAVVMRDTALPMSARMLYGLLTWKSNGEARCWPTNRTLAEELGLSQGRASALLALLEEYGHIEMEVIHDAQTGQVVRRYIYPLMKRMGGIPENEDTSPRDSADPPPENSEVYKEKQKEETKTPPKAPQGGQAASRRRKDKSVPVWKPERFEAFWALYPRREDRVGAVREWDRLKPDGALLAVMGRALRDQMAGELWRRGIGIPYACRWLKNRRWEDAPPEPAGVPSSGGGRVLENEKVQSW